MKQFVVSQAADNLITPWKEVLEVVKVSVSGANFSTWFSQTFVVSLVKKENTRQGVEIGCPSLFVKDTLEHRYFGLLQDALNQVTGVKNDLIFLVRQNPQFIAPQKSSPLFTQQTDDLSGRTKRAQLPQQFSFENFAVSMSNQLAWAAADAVAKNPGHLYNPLFLWGGVGVGKTHLSIATAREIIKLFPEKRVLYATGDEFIVEIIDAIRTKTTSDFKKKYRRLDILIVDDVQFIAGKETVQDEFFHTFNVIQREGGQIILTSDKPPGEIMKLEGRLQSRFEAGLIVDIEPPDFELRVAILLIKARERGIDLSVEFAQKIASVITQARKLEGFLVRLLSRYNHQKTPITDMFIDELLAQEHRISPVKAKPRVTVKDLLEATCDYFSVTKKSLTSPGRQKTTVVPRQILMYLLRTELDLPFQEIGRVLGGRDHTTIMYGVEKINQGITSSGVIGGYILGIKKQVWG